METFRFHLLSGRRPATWRPGAPALPPDRRTRLGWRPAAVAAVPPPGEGLRWPSRATPLSLRRSFCCPTVHSRAGYRFICSAVRKPSSLGAKNRNRLSSPVVLARRTTSDDRPGPLRAAKRETDDGTRGAWSTDATPGRAIGQGLEGGETRRRARVSETTLSRWEHGRQQPTLGHQQRLCEVLDKAPVELGFQEDILDVGTRREFMRQVTALVGTATMEAVLDLGGPEELDRFSLAVGRPTRVDRATVQHLETVTATHRELYHQLSSLELVDPVTGHLRGVTRLLRGAQHRLLRRRLAAIAGETAGHAAGCSMIWATRSSPSGITPTRLSQPARPVIRRWMRT